MTHSQVRGASAALALVFAVACASGATTYRAAASPQQALDALLSADRAFSAAAADGDALGAITAMLAPDVAMPIARGRFASGPAEVAEALRPVFGAPGARGRWTPIRGGISADGQHGFTFGYMTVEKPDTASAPFKYLAYWVRHPQGWRIAAYNVRRRPSGEVSMAMMPAALPIALVQATTDAGTLARHRESVIAAEVAFSHRAQTVGLGPAFVENGSADAVNMGGPSAAAFVVGNEAIGRSIGAGSPQPTSPVSWGADRALVASSGDLGVTFGVIRPNEKPAGSDPPTGFSFFTIWRRASTAERWRYVAE